MDGLKQAILDFLLKMFSTDMFDSWVKAAKGWIDSVLDELEDKIAAEPDWYDARVLALLAGIREAFNIPDNDDEVIDNPIVEDTPEPADPYKDTDG